MYIFNYIKLGGGGASTNPPRSPAAALKPPPPRWPTPWALPWLPYTLPSSRSPLHCSVCPRPADPTVCRALYVQPRKGGLDTSTFLIRSSHPPASCKARGTTTGGQVLGNTWTGWIDFIQHIRLSDAPHSTCCPHHLPAIVSPTSLPSADAGNDVGPATMLTAVPSMSNLEEGAWVPPSSHLALPPPPILVGGGPRQGPST